MDDGNSWIGIVLFAASVILFAVMYGFGAAVQALNTSALEDERDEGNKRAEKLLKIQEDPYLFIRTNQLATSILDACDGRVLAGVCGKKSHGFNRGAYTDPASGSGGDRLHCGTRRASHFCSRGSGS